MPKEIKKGEATASDMRQAELDKPKADRDKDLIERLNEATRATNVLNAQIKQTGKEAGLATSGLTAEPIVDKNGKVVGYKVK